MMVNQYKCMLVNEDDKGNFSREIVTRSLDELPKNEVLIRVKYSSLNYKDALSATGNKGVTRVYPHTPGIDAAGIVIESRHDNFKTGDEVIVTGYDLGMNTSGGFSEYISVPAAWIVKLPKNLSLRESMIYGTAGFTAALSIYKLIASDIKPSDGEILVTGATGGVGSVAVSILSKLGYDVIAATGKPEAKDMLMHLGAKDIVLRDELNDQSKKILLKGRWAGVIDTVGGHMLETAIKSTQYGGCVTCCGNVASHELSTTVYPFIIRGISLLGIDSVQCPMNLRKEVWEKLSGIWKSEYVISHVEEVSLMSLTHKIDQMLVGKSKGRIIVKIDN